MSPARITSSGSVPHPPIQDQSSLVSPTWRVVNQFLQARQTTALPGGPGGDVAIMDSVDHVAHEFIGLRQHGEDVIVIGIAEGQATLDAKL